MIKKLAYVGVAVAGSLVAGLGGWFAAGKIMGEHPSVQQAKAQTDQISESRRSALVRASQIVSPAVVSVTVVGSRTVESPFAFDPFWGPLLPPRYRTEKVVSLGSGFIISPDGYVITNEHVIHDGDSLVITLTDGRSYRAKLVGSSYRLDIALLKVKAKNLPYVKMGDSNTLLPGEWAIAVGNPMGYLLEDLDPTITVGVISALGRSFKGEEEGRVYRNMIQTDAAVNPGNSGGPLANADGEVIGMNTFIFSKSGGSEGLGFAIPSNTLIKAIDEIKHYGEIREAYIGVAVQNINRDVAQAMGYDGYTGVAVVSAEAGCPLKVQDIIVEAGGRPIRIVGDWEDATYFLVPGEKIPVRVFRNGKYIDLVLKARKVETQGVKVSLGLELAVLNPSLQQKYNIHENKGLVVIGVQKGSFAESMGIMPGDLILQVNGKAPQTPQEFDQVVKASRGLLKMVISRKGSRFYMTYRY